MGCRAKADSHSQVQVAAGQVQGADINPQELGVKVVTNLELPAQRTPPRIREGGGLGGSHLGTWAPSSLNGRLPSLKTAWLPQLP